MHVNGNFIFLVVYPLLMFLSNLFFCKNMHISPLVQDTLPYFNS